MHPNVRQNCGLRLFRSASPEKSTRFVRSAKQPSSGLLYLAHSSRTNTVSPLLCFIITFQRLSSIEGCNPLSVKGQYADHSCTVRLVYLVFGHLQLLGDFRHRCPLGGDAHPNHGAVMLPTPSFLDAIRFQH